MSEELIGEHKGLILRYQRAFIMRKISEGGRNSRNYMQLLTELNLMYDVIEDKPPVIIQTINTSGAKLAINLKEQADDT